MSKIISFIIPVYNSEQYIEQCVRSIVASGSTEIEIVLVDDGSKDSSGALCDSLAVAHEFIKVIHKENGGVASARNTGLEASEGEYVFFVDNDDWIDGTKVSNILEIIKQKKPDIIFHRYLIVDLEKGNSVGNAFIDPYYINGRSVADTLNYIRTHRINVMAPWEYIVRKDVIVRSGAQFNTEQNGVDDSCFSPMLYISCNSFFLNEDIVYYWRQRPDSQGRTHQSAVFIKKMISTIQTLSLSLQSVSKLPYDITTTARRNYLLFSIYKNSYSLLGRYFSYTKEDRLILDTWYDNHKDLINESSKQSGTLHRLFYTVFGGYWGTIISYKMATLKGAIHTYIYGHTTRIKK